MRYILILIAVILVGCSGLKETKSRNYYLSHKDKLSELCASEYPSETKYIKGDTIVKVKEVKGETVFVDCPDGTKKECPENKTIYKTIHQTDTIVKSNTALERKLQYRINNLEADNTLLEKEKTKLEKEVKELKDKYRRSTGSVIGLGLMLTVVVFLIIRKQWSN